MEGQSSGDLACPTMSLMSKLDLSSRRSRGTWVFGEIFNSRELMKGREGVWQLECQRGMKRGVFGWIQEVGGVILLFGGARSWVCGFLLVGILLRAYLQNKIFYLLDLKTKLCRV